jgi:hypothetical protein
MKGPSPIEIPGFFVPKWYIEQKELGKTDVEIAKELFISTSLLDKWKVKVGHTPGSARKYAGRKYCTDPKEVKPLLEKGLSQYQIADILGVSQSTVRNYIAKLKVIV